jgi:hypothetical protein
MNGVTLEYPSTEVLAREIEFAMAYVAACNPGRDVLGQFRRAFSEEMARMLIERYQRPPLPNDFTVPDGTGTQRADSP